MTMDNSGYVALSHQMVLQRQMEVIAHNIANANTGAYKSDTTLFETFLMDGGNNKKIAYVQDFGVLINFREGQLESTGNQLDLAIQGPGFLVAQTANGVAYTRAGHLTVNQRGELSTEQGDAILDENRRPIIVADPALGNVMINPDGTVAVDDARPVRLLMVEFDNPQQLRRRGAGYFVTDAPERPSAGTRVIQGMIERSNVEPVLELAAMIETSRAYQHSNKLMETEHELQRKMADRLPQLR